MSIGQKEGQMSLGKILTAELDQESAILRKCLERLPADKFDWKPHEKSTPLVGLATHLVDMFGWVKATLTEDELDFAKMDHTPKNYADTSELVAALDETVAEAREILSKASSETMGENWTLRNGEQVFFTMHKAAVLRVFVFNHIVHHRGQLSVYMRLLDIPVPGIYGPSADEPDM